MRSSLAIEHDRKRRKAATDADHLDASIRLRAALAERDDWLSEYRPADNAVSAGQECVRPAEWVSELQGSHTVRDKPSQKFVSMHALPSALVSAIGVRCLSETCPINALGQPNIDRLDFLYGDSAPTSQPSAGRTPD